MIVAVVIYLLYKYLNRKQKLHINSERLENSTLIKEKRKENGFNSNLKLIFQIYSNLIRFKQDLPELRKFEIKYEWKVFNIRNNFPYKEFLRFKMDFELKFREAL